jgi:DNA-binding NarL/FixJ family response regulator
VIRVVIADDQPLMREGLRTILDAQSDIEVVGEASNGVEACDQSARLMPDVIVMDVRMPGVDGIEATRRLREAGAPARVLVLTTFDDDESVYEALSAGAAGFILKTTSPAQLAGAVRSIAEGDRLLAPELTRRLIEAHVGRPPPGGRGARALADLTDRELEVLTLVGRGRSNADIAAALFLSPATVKTHINRIFGKLDLRDRAQAVVVAYETGLVTPGAPDD